jgi:hypothetical protein
MHCSFSCIDAMTEWLPLSCNPNLSQYGAATYLLPSVADVKNVWIFLCSLFNDSVSNSDYIVLNNWKIMDDKLERMCKEVGMAQFQALS